jgi:hypothetical protein
MDLQVENIVYVCVCVMVINATFNNVSVISWRFHYITAIGTEGPVHLKLFKPLFFLLG